jgi:hypothetical protein
MFWLNCFGMLQHLAGFLDAFLFILRSLAVTFYRFESFGRGMLNL